MSYIYLSYLHIFHMFYIHLSYLHIYHMFYIYLSYLHIHHISISIICSIYNLRFVSTYIFYFPLLSLMLDLYLYVNVKLLTCFILFAYIHYFLKIFLYFSMISIFILCMFYLVIANLST